jgi:integrase
MIPIVDRCGMAGYLRQAEPFLPLQWAHMSKRLPERCRAAKIPELTPNDLRRTVATRLIESGVDAYTTAKITRHATLIMLKRVYDRSNTAATRALIDKPAGTKSVQKAKKKAPAASARKRKST